MRRKLERILHDQLGAVQGDLITVTVGLVLIAVAFIIFPIVIEGAEETRLATNISQYTGLGSIVKIGPTLVFVGLLFGGVMATFFGARALYRSRSNR